jgi:hypothetical protein
MRTWWRRGVLTLTIAAFACLAPGGAGQQAAAKTPAFALLDPADAAHWQTWAADAGWQTNRGNKPGTDDSRRYQRPLPRNGGYVTRLKNSMELTLC